MCYVTTKAGSWVQRRSSCRREQCLSNFSWFSRMIQSYDFNFQGYTALHLAVIQGHESVIASLFDCGTKILFCFLVFIACQVLRATRCYLIWLETTSQETWRANNVLTTSKCLVKVIFQIDWEQFLLYSLILELQNKPKRK